MTFSTNDRADKDNRSTSQILSPSGRVCHVSGLPIFRKPEWTDVDFGTDFRLTASIIGENIIFYHASGYATIDDAKNTLQLSAEIANTISSKDRAYVQISDYSNLRGVSFEARKYYINTMRNRDRLLGLIYYGTSLSFKISIMLAKRLNVVKFNVQIVDNYSEAVGLALEMLQNDKSIPTEPQVKDDSHPSALFQKEGHFPETATHGDWSLQLDGFSTTMEIIDREILHSVSTGLLREEHVKHVTALREKVNTAMPGKEGFDYLVACVKDLKKGSRRARRVYMDSLKQWHAEKPFRAYIFYGANRFMSAAANMARPLMPFRVHVVKDLDSALEFIKQDREENTEPSAMQTDAASTGEILRSDQTQRSVDELLLYLGNIDWEADGFDYSKIDSSHPFKPVFDAIALIKEELDELLKERNDAAKALKQSEQKLLEFSNQTEQLSLAAASMISIKEEQTIFNKISKAIVEHSDFGRVIISLFKDAFPYRDIIGYGGLEDKTIERLRKVEMPKSWYDGVFEQGEKLGQSSYYIPHKMKHILNQEAVIYGEGPPPDAENSWHPQDNLFVRMNDERGEFIGVISVDESKSGLKPSNEIVRPLEIFSSLISQIIILKREQKERKKLEQQLIQAHKMEAVGTLTGGIAHDFNNMLGIILGNTELAMDDVPEWNAARLNLEEIKTASLRAKDVVRQLLSFARRTDQERKPVELNPIIIGALKLLRSSIPTSIEIRSNIPREPAIILADPTQIHQIMISLCTNATHAMEEDGGVLEISLGSMTLDESSAQSYELSPGRYVKLTVTDTGHGIDPEIKVRIFDPYFTTKEVGKGSGMGLAVVHGIVMSHDGVILVDSAVGKGTSLNIFLPVIESEPVSEAPIDEDLPTGKERILLVDDEESIIRMGHQRLERLGYKVESTTSPLEALDIFRSEPKQFDLVITDLTMPKMTGDKLVKEILNIRSNMPIIICTGFSKKMDREIARKIDAAGYLEKPHEKRDLAKMVRNVLDGKER